MVSGIGLDVIKYSGAKETLFKFKWYDSKSCKQDLYCHYRLWTRYYKEIKSMYIPFVYKGVYQLVHKNERFP